MKIYYIKLEDINEFQLERLFKIVNDYEKINRIQKFMNKQDKIRTLLGEVLIRNIATKELNIKNSEIEFLKNKYGKPYIKNHQIFQFNISHSGNYLVCAIDNSKIGIDIEEIKSIEYKDIAENFFVKEEFEYIMQNDSKNKLDKFYNIWTLKESYIKCCGEGLSIPLKSFSFEIVKDKSIRIKVNDSYKLYNFKVCHIDVNYKVAICSVNKEITDELIEIKQSTLIEECEKLF